MRHLFPLRFEDLEARRLLSRVHVAVAHEPAKTVRGPISLDGTLTVNIRGASTIENDDGSSNTTTPVAGQLGTLGKVHGVWNQATDAYGDSVGYETLRLRTAKGAFVIEFSDQSGHTTPAGHGAVSYKRPQQIVDVPGPYAHISEKGTIDLVTNRARTGIASMVIITQQS